MNIAFIALSSLLALLLLLNSILTGIVIFILISKVR